MKSLPCLVARLGIESMTGRAFYHKHKIAVDGSTECPKGRLIHGIKPFGGHLPAVVSSGGSSLMPRRHVRASSKVYSVPTRATARIQQCSCLRRHDDHRPAFRCLALVKGLCLRLRFTTKLCLLPSTSCTVLASRPILSTHNALRQHYPPAEILNA